MARELGAALDHAHAQGVVHRDVKPGNVLLRSDGVTKLVDLGIATAADNTRITHSGTVLGTAAYMAPEQLEGRAADAAADIYGMAAVCFEALCGERPRSGRTPMQIAHAIASGPAPDLLEHWPSLRRRRPRRCGREWPGTRMTGTAPRASSPRSSSARLRILPSSPRARWELPRVHPASPGGAARPERPEPPGGRKGARRSGAAAGLAAAAPAGAERPKATRLVGGRGTRAGAPPYGTHVGRRTRNRLPVIGLAAFIVAFAVAIAIAALSSGGDDDPARSPAAGAQREERAGTGGGESTEGLEEGRQGGEGEAGQGRVRGGHATARGAADWSGVTAARVGEPGAGRGTQRSGLRADERRPLRGGRTDPAAGGGLVPAGTDDITYAYALFNLGSPCGWRAGRKRRSRSSSVGSRSNQTDVVQRSSTRRDRTQASAQRRLDLQAQSGGELYTRRVAELGGGLGCTRGHVGFGCRRGAARWPRVWRDGRGELAFEHRERDRAAPRGRRRCCRPRRDDLARAPRPDRPASSTKVKSRAAPPPRTTATAARRERADPASERHFRALSGPVDGEHARDRGVRAALVRGLANRALGGQLAGRVRVQRRRWAVLGGGQQGCVAVHRRGRAEHEARAGGG